MDLYPLNRRCWVCFNFPDPTGQSMAHWRHVPAKEWPQSVHDVVGNLPDYRDRGRIIDGVRVGVSEFDSATVMLETVQQAPQLFRCETCGRMSESKTGAASHARKHAREAVSA